MPFAADVAGGAASRAAAAAFLAYAAAAFDGLGCAASGLPARGLAAVAAARTFRPAAVLSGGWSIAGDGTCSCDLAKRANWTHMPKIPTSVTTFTTRPPLFAPARSVASWIRLMLYICRTTRSSSLRRIMGMGLGKEATGAKGVSMRSMLEYR